MRPELQKAIADWKNQAIHETREVTVKGLKGGEYIIVISAAIDLDLEGQIETVYQYKFLLTMAQSGDTNRNPRGDVYNFEKASNLVINKFLDRCSKVIEIFIGNNTSDFESV